MRAREDNSLSMLGLKLFLNGFIIDDITFLSILGICKFI